MRIQQKLRVYLLFLPLLLFFAEQTEAQYFNFGKNRVNYSNHVWSYIQSKHFDVYYYEGGAYLARFTADAAEDAYNQISKDFNHEISDRITIMVYQSHNDFAVNNAAPLPDNAEGIGGVTELYKNRVIMPFTGDYADYRRLIHHELTHAVVNDMFYGGSIQNVIQNRIQLNIPLWFNEGIAEYQAQGWDTNSDMYVREAILTNQLDRIEQLDGYFAYRGGQSVWDYISEQYGREKIGEIMQKLRLTRSVESAFKQATGLSLKELSERWQSSLKKVYWPEVAIREDLNDTGKLLISREKGFLYTSAAEISPQGDQMVFISTRDGLFDVFLARTSDGKVIRRLANGQDNNRFESLKILSPGIAWNAAGTHIALPAKSKASDVIQVMDVKTRKTKEYRIPEVDAIISIAWHPKQDAMAVSATKDAQSDIYLLDMKTGEAKNLTNDVFSDMEPEWAPDGSFLAFHSDRGSHTRLAMYQPQNFNMMNHNYAQNDLYKLVLGQGEVTRITNDEKWDEKSPVFGNDPNLIAFISDRNGIPNLYAKNLTTGEERPLTNVITGITQASLSADGKKVVLNSLEKGTPSIYLLKDPFSRMKTNDSLVPNVWAQRVTQTTDPRTPALAMVDKDLIQANPFLRDATDGNPFPYKSDRPGNIFSRIKATVASTSGVRNVPDNTSPVPTKPETGSTPSTSTTPSPTPTRTSAKPDTTHYGGKRVDFRNYVFNNSFDTANKDRLPEDLNRFDPTDNVDSTGAYRDKKYKLKFTTDLINGAAGYSTLYGVQGNTTFAFSDVTGDHQLVLATNLMVDLRNSDYLLAYTYLPKRIDWTMVGYHNANIIALSDNTQYGYSYYRYRSFGGGVMGSYPIDKFRRIEGTLSLASLRQTNISYFNVPVETRSYLYPSISYQKDVTVDGYTFPVSGYRYGITFQSSPFSFGSDKQVRFGTVLGDFRYYKSLMSRYYTLAVRLSGGHSFGKTPQLFYTAGTGSYWINRRFDSQNDFPILDVADFELALPVMPLRGFDVTNQYGSTFGLVNAEFRFPLIAALLPGPIPVIPLYNIQGVAFVDAGSIWGGRNEKNPRFNLWKTDATGSRVFDDVRASAGLGIRIIALGYPIQLDWAWPYTGKGFEKSRFLVSLGLDF